MLSNYTWYYLIREKKKVDNKKFRKRLGKDIGGLTEEGY